MKNLGKSNTVTLPIFCQNDLMGFIKTSCPSVTRKLQWLGHFLD